MKTYPILRSDGTPHAFEISSIPSLRLISKVLNRIEGVSSIKRVKNSDDERLEFQLYGCRWIIFEPWGDNSRYWIGPDCAEAHNLDVRPILYAFSNYNPFFIKMLRI